VVVDLLGEQSAALAQILAHGGIALPEAHACVFARLLGEDAARAYRVQDRQVPLYAALKVLAAMARRGVHDAGAGVHGHVVHGEVVAAGGQDGKMAPVEDGDVARQHVAA
jgi:hypothetical protein